LCCSSSTAKREFVAARHSCCLNVRSLIMV
jgi:hypothetical protein